MNLTTINRILTQISNISSLPADFNRFHLQINQDNAFMCKYPNAALKYPKWRLAGVLCTFSISEVLDKWAIVGESRASDAAINLESI